MLKDMNIEQNTNGMENVLIWHFKNLGYRVINPCWRVKIYHAHCQPIRTKGRKRENRGGKVGLAPFTNATY